MSTSIEKKSNSNQQKCKVQKKTLLSKVIFKFKNNQQFKIFIYGSRFLKYVTLIKCGSDQNCASMYPILMKWRIYWFRSYISQKVFIVLFLLQEILVYMGYFFFRINLQIKCNKLVLVLGRDCFVVL